MDTPLVRVCGSQQFSDLLTTSQQHFSRRHATRDAAPPLGAVRFHTPEIADHNQQQFESRTREIRKVRFVPSSFQNGSANGSQNLRNILKIGDEPDFADLARSWSFVASSSKKLGSHPARWILFNHTPFCAPKVLWETFPQEPFRTE